MKVTAKQDTTIVVDSKVASGKRNVIFKNLDLTSGTATSADVAAIADNTDGGSSIYVSTSVDVKAGDVLYIAGENSNIVVYAVDGLVGSTTTTTTTTETTTETTTANVADLTGKLVYRASSEKSNYTVDDKTIHVDFKLDSSNLSSYLGLNNTTFYIEFNPAVVKPVKGYSGDVATDAIVSGIEVANAPVVSGSKLTSQFTITPSNTNKDYLDLDADGVKTAAELGRVKMAAAYLTDEPVAALNDGILFGIDFEIVGEGDAAITIVPISANAKPADKLAYDVAYVGQSITVGEDVVTSTTETTTEATTTTTTETTTGNSGNDTPTETTTATPDAEGYDYVPSAAVEAAGVVFDGSKGTVEAMQPLLYKEAANGDKVVIDDNTTNTYYNYLQTNGTNTKLSLAGADAVNYRVALKVTAKEDGVITFDHKVASGKRNIIVKNPANFENNGTVTADEAVVIADNVDGGSSIYVSSSVPVKAGDVLYIMGENSNIVVYAVDGVGTVGASNETTTTTTTETTTETTTVALEANQVGLQPVPQGATPKNGRNEIVNGTVNEVTVDYVLTNNKLNGVNSYTFFIKYDPAVITPKEVTGVNGTIATASTIEKALKVVPAEGNTDYPGADGVKTAAELGIVKIAYVASLETGATDAILTEDGAMFSIVYTVADGLDVNAEHDSQIAVELVGTGFQSSVKNEIAGNGTVGVAIDGSLVFVPAEEETTTKADDSTTTTVTTTTETTTETTTADTTETTTKAPVSSTTTTTTTTTTTEATSETTTVRTSSGGGGGGGGSSRSATTTTTTEATTESTTEATEPTTAKVIYDTNGNILNINPPTEDVRGDHNFVDLGNYGWADEAINSLYKLGIINGVSDEYYAPALGCKRGDFAIIINNCLGLDLEPTKNFDDNTDQSKYYYNACRVGYTAGILSGYGDGNYKPEKYCSREEMFVLVAKTLEFLGEDVTSTSLSVNDKYNDVDSISWWAAPYCAYLTANGIVGGTADGNAEPQRNINRAEMAVMMYKDYQFIVDKYGKALEQAAEDVTADDETSDEDVTAEGDETVEESTEETTSTITYGRGKTKIRTSSATTTTSSDSSDDETEE
jgi:hypothetical protein